jgi:hypothetical protein
VRDKALAILWSALLPEDLMSLAGAARDLEAAVFAQHPSMTNGGGGDPGPEYKRRLRILWGWLSSDSGCELPQLKRALLHGALPPPLPCLNLPGVILPIERQRVVSEQALHLTTMSIVCAVFPVLRKDFLHTVLCLQRCISLLAASFD